MIIKAKFIRLSVLCVVCGFLLSCTTVPQTGRKALTLVPTGQLTAMASSQFEQLKKETPISDNPEYTEMVQRVGERIAKVAAYDMPDANWEFVVFDNDEQINAFAMPGGKVAVYTGLFKVAETEAELAVVMGHELAHVVARHGNERMSQQLLAMGGAVALNYGTKDKLSAGEQQLLMAAYGAGTTIGIMLPYSRYHESEADEIGIMYTAKAGYDPRVAIGFWQKMSEQKEGQAPPEILSTHPADSTRIARLKELMPTAVNIYENR